MGPKMVFKSKFKFCALLGIAICVLSLLVHLAKYSTGDFIPHRLTVDDFYPTEKIYRYKIFWGPVHIWKALQPHADPRGIYPAPKKSNGFIYIKIYGGFDMIRSSICDIVAVSRLLNATLVIPEIQESLRSKGVSSKLKSFSYLYNEEQFIASLSSDVFVVKSLPDELKEDRKKNKFPVLALRRSASVNFYIKEILPKLIKSTVLGFVIADGGCLESVLPPRMAEYQRLRCRVAFHALQFRPEILSLGNQMVERLRAYGRPYLSYHPGLVKDRLAFQGCAELFQDVHTELIQHKRRQMIKRGIIHGNLSIDSLKQKTNGLCPLLPEEVGILLRAIGYPSDTIIYLAGAETFGGQRMLIPLRAMYPNTLDRTCICSEKELSYLLGPESPIQIIDPKTNPPPATRQKSVKEQIEEWKRAGPRPRPLPPPPARPIYQHEKEGWYASVGGDDNKVSQPSILDLRMQAHRLIWDAIDYYVSVESDAFFPGFHNDGSGWPDFSSLVMGHRLYQMPSGMTYRPDRKILAELFDTSREHLYHPKRNWTTSVRGHLNKSLGVDGFKTEALTSKHSSFLSHPLPECACRASKPSDIPVPIKGPNGEFLLGGEDQCPEWMVKGLSMLLTSESNTRKDEVLDENEPPDQDFMDNHVQLDNTTNEETKTNASSTSSEQDEEIDPSD